MNEYDELPILLGATVEQVVTLLQEYNKQNMKVSYKFNGVMLYSDTVTLDSAYKSITGMSEQDFKSMYGVS